MILSRQHGADDIAVDRKLNLSLACGQDDTAFKNIAIVRRKYVGTSTTEQVVKFSACHARVDEAWEADLFPSASFDHTFGGCARAAFQLLVGIGHTVETVPLEEV